ncbi:TrbI F-type domain-containing protein [Novosphingobium panipatense]|uniref:TrbI F-type domain-containing protein n=1 Tax=Novosphingobium panipatense TaxID=428991 RepID=UPI00360922F8
MGAWVSREVARPREQIVTVRLAETIARFVDAEARAAPDPEVGQARTLAYLKAAEAAVQDMGKNGRVVLVAEAVLAGEVPDATAELEQRIAARLGREPQP